LRKGGGREDGGEDGGGGGTKVSNIRRNATGFETEIETVRAGGDELRHNRGFSRRKRLGKGEFSGNAVKAEKVPYLDMDMKKREKEVTLEPAKKMRLGEVKVGNVRRNGIRLSAIEEGDELASPAANSLSGRGDGIKVSNVVRNGSGFESLEVILGLENQWQDSDGGVEKDRDERLAWMWVQGWRARLRGAGDLVEKCRY
jgi:hypothetical protein